MLYIRNGQEIGRNSFWNLLKTDLTDPETGNLMETDYQDAKRALTSGEQISAGQHYRTMSTYKIVNAE